MNPRQEYKKLKNSFKYAKEGFISSFKTERNMKIHVFAAILVVIIGIILKLSVIEWAIFIILIGLVISAELFNTAIETIVDMICPERNDNAKLVKDISAAAVLVMAICSAIIGIMVIYTHLR